MKKILKIITLSSITLILFIYLSFAGYVFFSEPSGDVATVKESLQINSKEDHEFVLIDSGLESLQRRIAAIERAKTSIELEYFIYELDLAAQIISYKLIEAAKRGVKVRVLVDSSAPVFKLRPEYAKYLDEENVEVKYYNTAPLSSFIQVQHRSHRKFLIIDSNTLITGGRNIGNDYFSLSKHYNFLDSDVEITGPIVKNVKESFLKYWTSDLSVSPSVPDEDISLDFVDMKKIQLVLNFLKSRTAISKTYVCNDLDFVSDSPGVETSNRKIYRYLEVKLKSAKKSIVVESPYFVLRKDGLNLIKDLKARGVNQTYLTNSLFSTDAYYTVSAMIPVLSELEESNINILLYNGEDMNSSANRPYAVSNRWGLHAKRAVIDKKHTLIGTYNIDPRSANLNSEVLISCNNNLEIAEAALRSMSQRQKNSWPLFSEDSSALTNLMKKSDYGGILKFLFVLPLAHLFSFLL